MSISKREDIRKAVVATLGTKVDGLWPIPAVEDRVYASRTTPMVTQMADGTETDPFPCICVYTVNDRFEEITSERPGNPPQHTRELDLVVQVFDQADGFDDSIDEIAEKVERLVQYDQGIGTGDDGEDLAETVLHSSTRIGLTAEGDREHGTAEITFSVVYEWTPPAVDLDWFNYIYAGYELADFTGLTLYGGGSTALVSGGIYYLVSGEINSYVGGPFQASAGDASAFSACSGGVEVKLLNEAWDIIGDLNT